MERAVLAVILGTFTLRLATGVTGAMLIYYYAVFPAYGGEPVQAGRSASSARCSRMELVLSPVFGVLSDRVGHRRIMLVGPAFGASRSSSPRSRSACRHRLHAAPRGRLDRRVGPVDPRVHRLRDRGRRAPARQGGRPVRGRDPRRAPARVRRRRTAVRGHGSDRLHRQRRPLRRLVRDLSRGVPADAEPEPAARAHDPARACAATRASCAAAMSGSSPPRGSPSTRRWACTPARRCSSSSGTRTRHSPASS